MDGHAKPLLKFLNGADNRFIIPVYQRNYDWSQKQCKQLFDDLVQVAKDNRKSHFFGSIVSTLAAGGSGSDFLIIDGQQRITTVSILFVAIVNLLHCKKIQDKDNNLERKIKYTYLIDEYSSDERKLRLKPIKKDCLAFDKIVEGDADEFVKDSHITQNYEYFCERILSISNEISVDELFASIKKLEIIDIFVEKDEDPQLIFESLNSTGLDLTEADKIRNFILMGLSSDLQNEYYEKYWNKIENYTCYKVSDFIRHYLTFKQKKIPNVNAVYFEFKEYVQKQHLAPCNYGDLLSDMLFYAKIYGHISSGTQNDWNVSWKIKKALNRLNLIDVSVCYPFLLALFSAFEKKELEEIEVEKSLLCIESFVFRRLLCGYPTNALNKIFTTLDFDIKRLNKVNSPYSSVLIYVLESKTGSAEFPPDRIFAKAIQERQVYKMQKKNKQYLFDRLENKDTVEHVNVIELMDSTDETNKLTIEHIMPQTLSVEWKQMLGENWKEIFDTWIHTLSNLTLTGYNSKYGNEIFSTKKSIKHGFADSGLNINKPLLKYDKWTEAELKDRCELLTKEMLSLWDYPKTDFVPPQDADSIISFDEAEDLTGRKLVSFSYNGGEEQKTSQWSTMYTSVAQALFNENYAPMIALASSKKIAEIDFNKKDNPAWVELGQGIFLYKANSTIAKQHVLEKIFEAYEKDKSELIFHLKNEKSETE